MDLRLQRESPWGVRHLNARSGSYAPAIRVRPACAVTMGPPMQLLMIVVNCIPSMRHVLKWCIVELFNC